MSHYFIDDESLKSNQFTFDYNYGNHKLVFISDNGVFSKKRVDYGTNLLLNSFTITPNSNVLDVGCGIGIIGLSLAKVYGDSLFHLIDVNHRALGLAKKNAKINSINNVKIYESNLYKNVNKMFDIIISNPPIRAGKKVVHSIIIDGFKHLNSNGLIYVVIQKKQGALSLIKRMEDVFGNATVINKKNGYFVIVSKKET